MEIVIPKGYRGASYVHELPQVDHREFELLFDKGTRFRVLQHGNSLEVKV